MFTIDSQVHAYEANTPKRPWHRPPHDWPASVTADEMVAAMDAVGVDGAIMVSSFSAYEYDYSYALEVYNKYPDKFRVVTPVDANDPAIDDIVAKWATMPGARGIRIRMREGLLHLCVEPQDQWCGRGRGRGHTEPVGHFKPWHA